MASKDSSNESAIVSATAPIVSVAMGSRSDLRDLRPALDILRELEIPFEANVVSAHRTPHWLFKFAQGLEARGVEVVIAGAGGAAHLPGMLASLTLVPVLGVPIEHGPMRGMDALLSICQMPKGVPVGTLAIGQPGAANAALLAAQMVGTRRPEIRDRLRTMREERAAQIFAEHALQ